jgi:5,5'-dehydrodivanillate O-demethylase
MMRRKFLQDLAAIERGEDPKGLIRDPARNVCVQLPVIGRAALVEGLSVEEILSGKAPNLARFIFQYGQPEDVRLAQEEALGIEVSRNSYVAGAPEA